jgi:hypothetical protein
MSEELLGVVVCHGSLAGALVQAAELDAIGIRWKNECWPPWEAGRR